jgi:16S rRNA (cytosine1402-N4)-methyltransferase
MNSYHIPVLLKESIDGLNISPNGIYIDVTYGGGGHSAEILKRIDKGRLYAMDQDEDAAENLVHEGKITFIRGNFRYLKNYLRYFGVHHIDGLIADLGVSSHHFNDPERGFTYRTDAALDMRMNKSAKITAETIINDFDTSHLARIFREYGELQSAGKLAAAIAQSRSKQRIATTRQFIEAIQPLIPRQTENQFLSKVFQAIRIEVNQELESLVEMLSSATEMLKPKGRLVVISYHSLEDRIVKNYIRWGNPSEEPVKDVFGNFSQPYTLISRKPLVPDEEELMNNPRSRSARLRIAERNENGTK